VPFLEAREKNHFIRVEADEWRKAIADLDANHAEGSQR
jgi:transketolase